MRGNTGSCARMQANNAKTKDCGFHSRQVYVVQNLVPKMLSICIHSSNEWNMKVKKFIQNPAF